MMRAATGGLILDWIRRVFREARWLHRRRVLAYLRILLIIYALVLVNSFFNLSTAVHKSELTAEERQGLYSDFVSFYAAGVMANSGEAVQIYHRETHYETEKRLVDQREIPYTAFFYPPVFILLCLPFAFFPYFLSAFLWFLAGAAAYLIGIWRILDRQAVFWIGFGAPAFWLNGRYGQNASFTAALLAGGLWLIDSKPFRAGLLLGLLCYKPHFGLVLPLVLLAGRRWRVIFGAATSVLALIAITWAGFGAETWRGFLGGMDFARSAFEVGQVDFYKFASIFACLRLMGAGIPLAYAGAGAAAVFAVAVAIWIWAQESRPWTRNAALIIATMLTAPILLEYDMLLAVPAILWLIRGATQTRLPGQAGSGFLSWERSCMTLVYTLPFFGDKFGKYLHVLPAPWMLIAMMALLLRRAVVERRADAERQAMTRELAA